MSEIETTAIKCVKVRKSEGYGSPYHVIMDDGRELVNMGVVLRLDPCGVPVLEIKVPLYGGVDLELPENLVTFDEIKKERIGSNRCTARCQLE